MKNALYSSLLFAAAFLLSLNQAEAQRRHHRAQSIHTYCSGYSSCGCAIYTQRFIRGHDCYGRPIYGYKRIPINHCCNHYNHRMHRHHQQRIIRQRAWNRHQRRYHRQHCHIDQRRRYTSPYANFSIRF